MRKQLLAVFILFYSLTTYAADTFFQTPTAPSQSTSSKKLPPVSTKVLSPAEFSKQVAQDNLKLQSDTQKQLSQQLSQIPATNGPAPVTSTATVPTPAPSAPKPWTGRPDGVDAPEELPKDRQPTPTPSQPPRPPQQVNQQPSLQPAQPQAAQPDIYMGFPSGSQQNPPGKTQQQSGGWNIQY